MRWHLIAIMMCFTRACNRCFACDSFNLSTKRKHTSENMSTNEHAHYQVQNVMHSIKSGRFSTQFHSFCEGTQFFGTKTKCFQNKFWNGFSLWCCCCSWEKNSISMSENETVHLMCYQNKFKFQWEWSKSVGNLRTAQHQNQSQINHSNQVQNEWMH